MTKALELLKAIKHRIDDFVAPLGGLKMGKGFEVDAAIADLEATLNRTCDTCRYFDKEYYGGDCTNFGFTCSSAGAETHRPDDDFCCNRWEAKDEVTE